jgi:deoxyhypusine synthase
MAPARRPDLRQQPPHRLLVETPGASDKENLVSVPPVSAFVKNHFRHFNARILREAAEAYKGHLSKGGKMLLALAGAMSTAEIGVSLAEMIRRRKIHAISCTGANLEEDIFNLVAHDLYESLPNYRCLSVQDELDLFDKSLNRVTDTCIPDVEIWNRLEGPFNDEWRSADKAGERFFPHEFVFRILRGGKITQHYQIDPKESWVYAAMERDLPIFVPGWEDSSLGNMYAGACIRKEIKNVGTVRSGIEAMASLATWYSATSAESSIGLFQVGGGIAGDFPISVVPLLHQDLSRTDIPKWGFFCQIGDSTTSYGSYSGAPPNEKASWGKLGATTPSFLIESDATIVAPLVFAYVLDW